MEIKVGDLKNEQVISLLKAHHEDMLSHSPVESVHALDLSALESPKVTFWGLWINNELAGCGALKELDTKHGEIKSMRTSGNYLRKGVARELLVHIINQATSRGYEKLSLETGSMAAFVPAHKLYQRFGFQSCQPFGDYQEDPYSLFMSKTIEFK
jgi:putative acetyltransferase